MSKNQFLDKLVKKEYYKTVKNILQQWRIWRN